MSTNNSLQGDRPPCTTLLSTTTLSILRRLIQSFESCPLSQRQARKREAKAKAQRRANSTGGIRGAPAAAAPADGAAAAVASLTLEDLDYRVRTRLFVIDQLLEPGGHP